MGGIWSAVGLYILCQKGGRAGGAAAGGGGVGSALTLDPTLPHPQPHPPHRYSQVQQLGIKAAMCAAVCAGRLVGCGRIVLDNNQSRWARTPPQWREALRGGDQPGLTPYRAHAHECY